LQIKILTMNKLIKKNNFFDPHYRFKAILIIIFLTGSGIRLFHFINNRSLWMDEIYLCSSFVHMDYLELASNILDYQQKAPIGFLWMVKLCTDLFGYHEMSLRIIPLIAGIISLFLFADVCKYYLKPIPLLIAVAIFAFSPALAYHSVECKQYSTECLATVLALLLFLRYQSKTSINDKVYWGILGGLLLWFSFSVIFILAGIAFGLTLSDIIKKDWKSLFLNATAFCLWLISFSLNYMLFTHKHADSEWVVYFFKLYDNFMPFPPLTLQQLKWFPRNFYDLMDYPLGLVWNLKGFDPHFYIKLISIPFLPILCFFTGIFFIFKNNRKSFYVFTFSIMFMLTASGLYLYPLLERFWVFISPVFIIFIAEGFQYIQQKFRSSHISGFLIMLLLIGPFIQSIYYIYQPVFFYKHKKSFEKECLSYINDNFIAGDAVYNYWNNAPGYKVYKHILNLRYTAVEGKDYRKTSSNRSVYNNELQKEFTKFSGSKRVWIICNTMFLTDIGDKAEDPMWYYRSKLRPAGNLIQQLSKVGTPVLKKTTADVTVYLFELTTDKVTKNPEL